MDLILILNIKGHSNNYWITHWAQVDEFFAEVTTASVECTDFLSGLTFSDKTDSEFSASGFSESGFPGLWTDFLSLLSSFLSSTVTLETEEFLRLASSICPCNTFYWKAGLWKIIQ